MTSDINNIKTIPYALLAEKIYFLYNRIRAEKYYSLLETLECIKYELGSCISKQFDSKTSLKFDGYPVTFDL